MDGPGISISRALGKRHKLYINTVSTHRQEKLVLVVPAEPVEIIDLQRLTWGLDKCDALSDVVLDRLKLTLPVWEHQYSLHKICASCLIFTE